MSKSLFFKQSKPLTVSILGGSMMALAFVLWTAGGPGPSQISTMLIGGLALLGYSVSFEMIDTLNHKKHLKMFGRTIFKQKLRSFSPEYISVFSALFKQGSEWGPVAALGGKREDGNYVIRFFKGNKHFTIWKATSLEEAKARAKELGALLKVEVRLRD